MSDTRVSFRELTTLNVGGSVARVERPESREALVALIKRLDTEGSELLLLGSGSNVLAPDEPYEGTVIIPASDLMHFSIEDNRSVLAVADAGVNWDTLVHESVVRGLWGLENLSAIPGTIGAAPMQNIGAYGAELADVVRWVEVYDRREKRTRTLAPHGLSFGYRTSVLKKLRPRFAVLRIALALSRAPRPNFAYKDLAERFAEEKEPRLSDVRDAVIRIRAGKFPPLDAYGTAGSFFLNPVLSRHFGERLLSRYTELPHYPTENDAVKVSLAWLLDHAVHAKGMRIGGAFVWDKQPLVIVTDDGATAADIRMLSAAIQKKVFDTTRVRIVPEVTFL